jgi:DNA-binding MarR family transcriptional regulator
MRTKFICNMSPDTHLEISVNDYDVNWGAMVKTYGSHLIDLSPSDALAIGTHLVTSMASSAPEQVVAFAEALIEEHGTVDTPTDDNRIEMKNPETIYRGIGWGLTFQQEKGHEEGFGFFRLDNNAGHGGAFTFPQSILSLAETLIDRFGEDDDAVIAMAQRLIDERTDEPEVHIPGGYLALSAQAQTVLQYMRRAGTISARDAMADLDMTSATLSRRICDIEQEGFRVIRERRQHPVTGKRYTRYSLADG